jgi:hypothetical protein
VSEAPEAPEAEAVEAVEAVAIDPVRRRAAVVATGVAVPVAVLLVLLFNRSPDRPTVQPPAGSHTGGSTSATAPLPPVPVQPPPDSVEAQRSCPPLVAALPLRLRDLLARPVTSSSPFALAWGEPPVVLRCGVPRPPGFVVGAANVVAVNGVTWYVQEGPDRAMWTVVDRAVYVEVSVPNPLASAPIPPISDAVTAALPGQPPRPGD